MRRSIPSIIAPPGWVPREASVSPRNDMQSSGVVSVIDNTVRVSPLPPKYGKTRERSLCETKPTLRMPMAPDTLVCAKGFNMSTLTKLTMSESMCAVLPPYSPSAKIYAEKYEPARYTSGFVMSPVTQGGKWMESDVAADFKSTFRKRTFGSPSPSDMSPMSTMSKFTFDQKASLPHIPVASRKLVFN